MYANPNFTRFEYKIKVFFSVGEQNSTTPYNEIKYI